MNDYEGIAGHEAYRANHSLLHFARVDQASGALVGLEMVPLGIRRFRLIRASASDARWLAETLGRTGKAFGTGADLTPENMLRLRWRE